VRPEAGAEENSQHEIHVLILAKRPQRLFAGVK